MKLVSITQISAIGKGCVAFILSIAGLLQIPSVKDFIWPLVGQHPHIASILGAILTLSALLSNPQVQSALGMKTETAVTTDTEAGTVTTTANTTITEPIEKP